MIALFTTKISIHFMSILNRLIFFLIFYKSGIRWKKEMKKESSNEETSFSAFLATNFSKNYSLFLAHFVRTKPGTVALKPQIVAHIFGELIYHQK